MLSTAWGKLSASCSEPSSGIRVNAKVPCHRADSSLPVRHMPTTPLFTTGHGVDAGWLLGGWVVADPLGPPDMTQFPTLTVVATSSTIDPTRKADARCLIRFLTPSAG